ncbi:hypothetical protein TJA_10910 [Thermus sp. LT1-2-5]
MLPKLMARIPARSTARRVSLEGRMAVFFHEKAGLAKGFSPPLAGSFDDRVQEV